MDQFEMQQALKIAKDREQLQQGTLGLAFILTCVLAYYAPEWIWFHDESRGWKNVLMIFVVDMAITFSFWWLIDRNTVNKKP
ncbi:MAG: hypothetical protein NTY41_02350 [Proteobacteria bacterium]|nr:hypothetical protein [Pseudomonadota bacterium]